VRVELLVKDRLVERTKIITGERLAESLVKVNNGYFITTILNTREQELEIPNLEVQLIEL
jgi:hypothetical protein